MGNQTIREQLFEILHNRKRMPGERFSDIEGKIENLVNQEVEKRIAERMPSEEEVRNELCRHLYNWLENNAFKDGCKWLRSRLTNDSQKTEGGGE